MGVLRLGHAHLHLGGCDVLATYKKSIDRLVYTDFKDATRTPVTTDYLSPNGERFAGDSHQGKFFNSILELGRGEIDFVALMQMLKDRNYRGWINHDIDTIRVSIPESLAHLDELHHREAGPGVSVRA